MFAIPPLRCRNILILLLAFLVSSCGGGSDSAGAGGSGIGGTGITTVAGNVSQIIVANGTQPRSRESRELLARLATWLSTPANAQSQTLGDIIVIGGGQQDTTNQRGDFALEGVAPSDNFRLIFEPPNSDESIVLTIGRVPEGARVQVVNVVLNARLGFANADDVDVQEDDADDDDHDSSDADDDDDSRDSGDSEGSDDDDSTDT